MMKKKIKKSILSIALLGLTSTVLLPSINTFASTVENEEQITNVSSTKVTQEETENFMKQIGVETIKDGDKEITTITDSQLLQILEFKGISIPVEAKMQFMSRANGVNKTVKHGNGVVDYYFSKGTIHAFLLAGGAIGILLSATPGAGPVIGGIANMLALYGVSQINHGKIFRFYKGSYKTSFNQ